ncbi:MAG: hypothetical protein AAB091_02365, partial [Elusimicrobiota bacterium]
MITDGAGNGPAANSLPEVLRQAEDGKNLGEGVESQLGATQGFPAKFIALGFGLLGLLTPDNAFAAIGNFAGQGASAYAVTSAWPSFAPALALGLGTIGALAAVLWRENRKETFADNTETQDEKELREFLQARGHKIQRLPGNAVDWILNGFLTEVKSLQPTTKRRGLKTAIKKASNQMKKFLDETLPDYPYIVPSEIEDSLKSNPNAPKMILVDVRRTQLRPKEIMDVIASWSPNNKQNLNVLALLPNQGQLEQGALYYESRSNTFVISELDRIMEPGQIPSNATLLELKAIATRGPLLSLGLPALFFTMDQPFLRLLSMGLALFFIGASAGSMASAGTALAAVSLLNPQSLSLNMIIGLGLLALILGVLAWDQWQGKMTQVSLVGDVHPVQIKTNWPIVTRGLFSPVPNP